MSQTTVARGSNLDVTQFSAALTAQIIRAPGNLSALTGPAPKQPQAEATIKQQTDPGMPFVRVADLASDPKGSRVTVDAFNITGGKPIMGDRNVEGNGKKLSSSSFEVSIDLAAHNVDAGGRMARQRTRWDLLGIARAQVKAYFPRLIYQRAITHCAGARGLQSGPSWDVPLVNDPDFAEVMVNPVQAPTYNRHLVVSSASLVQGGAQLGSIASTDRWKLSVLDELAVYLESIETKLPSPVMIGDEQGVDAPLKGILWLSPGSYNDLITDISTSNNLRAYQSKLEQRQKYAPSTALFKGECGIWRDILVKKMEHTILHNAGSVVKHVSAANRLTAAETDVTVNAGLGAGFQVERAILMGAQALARAEGASKSGLQVNLIENWYDAGRKVEYIGEYMGGEAKFRFKFPNSNGDFEPTDNGIFAIDAVSAKRVV